MTLRNKIGRDILKQEQNINNIKLAIMGQTFYVKDDL